MPLADPRNVLSKPELRAFAVGLLTDRIGAINHDQVHIHFPKRLGLMRLMPEMHFHLRPELFLQISGSTRFHFPEEELQVGPGEMCLVSRGLPHSEVVRADRGPFFNLVLTFHSDRFSLHLAKENPPGRAGIVVSIEIETKEGAHLADLLKNATDWFHQGSEAHRLAVKGSLLANLATVLAALEEEPADASEPVKVMQVRQVILQNLSRRELSVAWIGRSLQSSPDYLSRLFRRAMGKTLVAYVTERRMMRARDLLVSSTLNVSEISQACGYDDASYFTRVFRRINGTSPRHYRDRAMARQEKSPGSLRWR